MFYLWCLFLSSWNLRDPSADRRETLPHAHDRKLAAFYDAGPKIRWALTHKNLGPKHAKFWSVFYNLRSLRPIVISTSWILRGFKIVHDLAWHVILSVMSSSYCSSYAYRYSTGENLFRFAVTKIHCVSKTGHTCNIMPHNSRKCGPIFNNSFTVTFSDELQKKVL